MPAAAVIPAPIAYIKVVAVKKLVVERRVDSFRPFRFYLDWHVKECTPVQRPRDVLIDSRRGCTRYFEEIRVFQANFCCAYSSME